MRKSVYVCVLLLMISCMFPGNMANAEEKPAPVLNEKGEQIVVAIDAGHQAKANNGKEPIGPGAKVKKKKVSAGTQGVATRVAESRLNLDIALKLEKELESRGYKVYMVRRKQNVDISNKKRALRVNKSGADICIRIHADGSSNRSVKGASALCPSKKNQYAGKLSKKSRRLSNCILKSYCKQTEIEKRGVKERDDLTGTNWSEIPVTLLEMGFMSNPSEDRRMQKKSVQKKMVRGIADGVD